MWKQEAGWEGGKCEYFPDLSKCFLLDFLTSSEPYSRATAALQSCQGLRVHRYIKAFFIPQSGISRTREDWKGEMPSILSSCTSRYTFLVENSDWNS